MAVIIDEIIAETAAPPDAATPRDPVSTVTAAALTMEQLRFELRRDTDRRARLTVD